MRAIAVKAETATESFAKVLDQFAALRSYTNAPASIGGYRVLRPRQEAGAPKLSPALAALARARLRITGFLSAIFVGGLGLAVLAGPANCPCLGEFVAATEHTATPRPASVSRFAYRQPAAVIAAGELAAHFAGDLPMLSTAALLEPDDSIGVSPITTSATGPSRDAPALASDDLAPARVGRLPTKIEPLADVGPTTIRLANAANIESDAVPTLPAVTVDTPAIAEVAAIEAEGAHAGKAYTSRGAAKAKMHRNGTHASKVQVKGSKVPGQAPRWAQQMFETPWQTKAFSYYD
jgi:hypothetical protein